MQGFGPVELHGPGLRFEYPWEPAVVAMQSALEGTVNNIDEFRHAIERMDPVHYLGSTYFEHWLESFVTNCTEKGVITGDELVEREALASAGRLPAANAGSPSPRRNRGAHPFRREIEVAPRFAPGDCVRSRNFQPEGHTRLARYARDKAGVVDCYRGCFIFPDTSAHGLGECPQHLYSVRFEAAELWGDSAEAATAVYIDLFESYLEPAGG
jgi:nitrile hydratase